MKKNNALQLKRAPKRGEKRRRGDGQEKKKAFPLGFSDQDTFGSQRKPATVKAAIEFGEAEEGGVSQRLLGTGRMLKT